MIDECPNCFSPHVVPDGRRFQGDKVLRCMTCTSWFIESTGEPVLFVDDGGDDLPDGEINRDKYEE